MINRVKIRGYKSLRDVEITLAPLVVVFGPNAAGKSNLLDALGLLSRMVTGSSLSGAFVEHRGAPLEAFFYGDGGLESLLEREAAQFTIEVDVQLSDEVAKNIEERIRLMREGLPDPGEDREPSRRRVVEGSLRYSLTVELRTDTGYLRVLDERLVALNVDGSEKGSRKAFIELVGDRLRLRMEGQRGRPTEHRIGLPHTLVSRPLYPPLYPHITAFKEELSRWRFYYLEPKSMRAESPLKTAEVPGAFGDDLAAFYHTLRANNLRQFDVLNHTLATLVPGLEGFNVILTREGYLQLWVFEDGTPFSARVVSEGTLRILGLLAITAPLSLTTVVGYEEPENGVHPRRLKLIADMLENAAEGGKQIIVNTHSRELPDHFETALVLSCRKRGRETTFVPLDLPLFRPGQMDAAMEEETEGEGLRVTSLGERITRGDFGG